MDINNQFLINVLRDHIHQIKTEPNLDVDWSLIIPLTKAHDIQGIIYYQCKRFIPAANLNEIENAYATSCYLYVNRKLEMKRIKEALRCNGISFVAIKGLDVANYYPKPALRTMGDCDIVVSPNDMEKSISIIKKLGFNSNDSVGTYEYLCSKNDIVIEIHDSLIRNADYLPHGQKRFFNDYKRFTTDDSLDWSFHFLYLLMHIRKHLINDGIGIRQFMDLAVVIKYCPELNWKWIEASLEQLKLLKFAHVCFSLVERWFEINVPVDLEKIDGNLFEQITEYVLKNGVFGFSNTDNKNNREYNPLIFAKGPLWLKRIKKTVKILFPNYESMKGNTSFTYLSKRPYLLPVAWIHRCSILLVQGDKSKSVNTIKSSFIARDEIEKRKVILEKLGL